MSFGIRWYRKSFAPTAVENGNKPSVKRKQTKKTVERVAATKNLTARRIDHKTLPVTNLLAALLLWALVTVLSQSGQLLRPQQLVIGQQAPETIVASVDFWAETIAATELKRREAADRVLPVYRVETPELDRAEQALGTLLPRIESLQKSTDPSEIALLRGSIRDLIHIFSIPLTPDDLLAITPQESSKLKSAVLSALSSVVRRGIVSERGGAERITVQEPGKAESIREMNQFMTRDEGLDAAVRSAMDALPEANRHEQILRRLLQPWILPNVVRNETLTATRRQQARDLVEPVIEPVNGGTPLVRSGDAITAQTLSWLTAHEQRLSELETPLERMQRIAGNGLLLLVGLASVIAAAGWIDRQLLFKRKEVLLLLALSLFTLGAGKVLLYMAGPLGLFPAYLAHFAMPLALAPILASILTGPRSGLIAGLWTTFGLAVLCGNSFQIMAAGLSVTAVSIYATRDVKRRAALFRAGFLAGLVEIVVAICFALINRPAWTVLAPQLGMALLSGIIVALLALLLIPLLEQLFNVTTDITLLELSDLSHPLLQSLAINAPGTYHHSLMLATLAQNAAEAIGANALMLRVCAYFHDIGKLVKPGFFSENIQYAENPHDELSPSMSTLVIVSHIKEGVTLAKKHKLPQVIIDGIEQHQGTSLISVFYHRAKTLQNNESPKRGPSINDEDFRYEGPRPQTREMAILMLADSCEAASRSLEKPTPGRIQNLIEEIVDSRLRDGQLDECPLTLAELRTIRKSFVFSLTNMLHGRVAYPKDENHRKQPTD